MNGEMLLPRDEIELFETFSIDYLELWIHCRNFIWIPTLRSNQNYTQWVNAYNGSQIIEYLPWSFGQPNGYPTQNCVGAQVMISSKIHLQLLLELEIDFRYWRINTWGQFHQHSMSSFYTSRS
jgi:hypothetical protein